MELFGTVADLYDSARPGYPPEIAYAILAYHGGGPGSVTEVGAGTGKATEVLARLDAPLTCVEPDQRMADLLAGQFPRARIHVGTFEEWTPPAGGTDVLACAMAWHWLDPATRNDLAHDALAPGGTLAVFGHHYGYADPEQGAAIRAALRAVDPSVRERPAGWFGDDIRAGGRFTNVREKVWNHRLPLEKAEYLDLMRTFGPYLERPADMRRRGLTALGELLDGFGGSVVMELRTTLVLAARPR